MDELSIPVATMMFETKDEHSSICESIKSLRDSYREFCEDEDEFITTIVPIEQDPEPYANGTKKTRPILKKYAQALVDKKDLEEQLETEAEAQRDIHLTPQQVKADVKHYVSICEKKIAKQQEQCDALQKQVEQLSEVVRCMVTYPHLQDIHWKFSYNHNTHSKNSRLLSHCAMLDTNSLDYFVEQGVEIESENYSALHYAVYAKNIKNVKKIIDFGCDINYRSYLWIDGKSIFHTQQGTISVGSPLEVASLVGSIEIVKLLIEKGATIRCDKYGDITYKVPNGPEGDLVTGYLQTHGSRPVTRF